MAPTLITFFSTIGVALITLIGTVITTKAGNDKIEHELDKHNAVQDTKLEELTREVRQHNDFAIKIPVIDQRVTALEKEVYKNKG
jgi:Tfp pilus assembly protein PilN